MGTYFTLATKHLRFTLVKVSPVESVWRGLHWQRRKATISDLQDIKMLQQCIWLILYPARDQKPRVLEGFIKAHRLQGKHREKKHFKDTHVHTHTPAGAHIDMFTVSVSSCHPRSLSLTSLKYSWCFTASGHRTPATFLAINARHLEMIL